VLLTRAEAREESDPVVGKFLAFLARNMEVHPAQIRGISPALLRRARSLVKGVKVDLDAPLPLEDD
jgi:antitoxin PrlF